MSPSLKRRVAVVTGGAGALGRHVVQALVHAGARVVVPWVIRDEVERLSEFLGEDMTRVGLVEANLTETDSVERLFRLVAEEEGRLDALCNLVGGFVWAPLEDTSPDQWRKMLELNATSCFLCTRAAVPLMRESGAAGDPGCGKVVNVASMPALRGAANMSAYAAAKGAVLNLTRSLSDELVGDGVTVNAVLPSIIDTEQNRKDMPDADTATWLDPADVGKVIRFLVSEDAAIVTGAAVTLSLG